MGEKAERKWWQFDTDRVNARFHVARQMLNIANLAQGRSVSRADIRAFEAECPEEARNMNKLKLLGTATSIGAVAGFFGAGAVVWRWTKTPPLAATGAVMVSLAGLCVADNVASLALGTYKFDNIGTSEKFYQWLHDREAKQ